MASTRSRDHAPAIGLLAVLTLVQAALLLWGIGANELWLDEVMSVRVAGGSLDAAARFFAYLPEQHPFYYAILKLWMVFGESDGWVRVLSALFAVGTLWATYAFARRAYDEQTARVASVLAAFSPFLLYFGREARMYSLVALLAVLATHSLVAFLARPTWRTGLGYWVLCVLGVYTHFFFILLIGSHFFYLLLWRPATFRVIRTLIVAQILVGVAFVPWLLLLLQSSSLEGQSWKDSRNLIFGIPYTFLRFSVGYGVLPIVEGWKDRAGQLFIHYAWVLVPAAVGAGGLTLAGMLASVRRGGEAALSVLCLVGPMVMALLLSVVVLLMGERYFLVGFPFFLMLVADGGLTLVRRGGAWRRAALVLGMSYGGAALVAVGAMYVNPAFGTMQWRAVAADLETGTRPGDVVVVHRGYALPSLLRYYDPPDDQLVVRSGSPEADQAEARGRTWLVLAYVQDAKGYLAQHWSNHRIAACRRYPKSVGIRLLLLEPGPIGGPGDGMSECQTRLP